MEPMAPSRRRNLETIMPKRLILASIISFVIVASVTPAKAAECWTRSDKETILVPAGATLKPGGYMCVDHMGLYAELDGAGPREAVVKARPMPRSDSLRIHVQARPLHRISDLLNAGLAYPELVEVQASSKTGTGGAH